MFHEFTTVRSERILINLHEIQAVMAEREPDTVSVLLHTGVVYIVRGAFEEVKRLFVEHNLYV